MYRSSGSKSPSSTSRRVKFAFMMKRVDHVVAGNQFLKSEVLRYHSDVTVIPTSIDLSRYTLKEKYGDGGPMTIGWLGTSEHLEISRGSDAHVGGTLFETPPLPTQDRVRPVSGRGPTARHKETVVL